MKKLGDKKVVGASLAESVIQVSINLAIALFTGSVAMLSQALQGTSDVVTTGLLFHGVRQSKKQRDQQHQFGHGKAVFFWVLMAAIFMFLVTGVLSIYFGYQQLTQPGQLQNVVIALIVTVIGFSTNLYAFILSVRRLNQTTGSDPWWKRFLHSTMVETKVTLLIQFLGTAAAVVGFVSLGLYVFTGNVGFDGLAGIVIGVVLMLGSILLVYDVKSLIIGRAVPEQTSRSIAEAALEVDGVENVLDLRTMYIGASRLLIVIEVHLRDGLETDTIEAISDSVKTAIRTVMPNADTIQVEVETPESELSNVTTK